MYSASEIKLENNICNFCLSYNRILKPLGKYSIIFMNIMQEKSTLLASMDLLNTHICWECSAIMNKVMNFQNRVLDAQLRLHSGETEDMNIKSLSTLNIVFPSEANYVFTEEADTYALPNIFNNIKRDNEDIYDNIDLKSNEEELNSKDFNLVELNDEIYDAQEYYEELDKMDNTQEYYEELNKMDDTQEYSKQIDKNIDNQLKAEVKLKKQKNLYKRYQEYYTISEGVPYNENNCSTIIFNIDELSKYRNKLKNQPKFLNAKFKCSDCIIVRTNKKKLEIHYNKCHSKSSKHNKSCDICKLKFLDRNAIARHMSIHYRVYLCKLCDSYYQTKTEAKLHLREHEQVLTCRVCQLPFTGYSKFHAHYKECHFFFICDYCGKKCRTKAALMKHIPMKHLPKNTLCDICKKSYKNLRYHKAIRHTVSATPSYCVECDLSFCNRSLYKRHLTSSAKHQKTVKKKSVPCPLCNKIYARHIYMKNHYEYVHQQQSKFKCDICEKSFLNGFRLRQHKASIHDKIPLVKNKLCNICGRGFTTNRILDNHVRTHTGERPNQCPHCPASFIQRTAMLVHIKNIHVKKNLI